MLKVVLLVVLAIVVVAWLRGARRARPPHDASPGPAQAPGERRVGREEMVSCVQCGVHLPRSEAVAGPLGSYCSDAHRLTHETQDPPA